MRYLGVALISTKLKYQDCQPLNHNITERARSWTTKWLSYAGRLQLFSSVIYNMAQFWWNHFMLPATVIHEVQQICSSFLWKGKENNKGAKVSWSNICLPWSEGGLGLKDMKPWNTACILCNLWQILTNAGSLWVAWALRFLLKSQNIWTIKPLSSCSWNWRTLLRLRGKARPLISYKVGDGSSIYFWYDTWASVGPLRSYFRRGEQIFLALLAPARLSAVFRGGHKPVYQTLMINLLLSKLHHFGSSGHYLLESLNLYQAIRFLGSH